MSKIASSQDIEIKVLRGPHDIETAEYVLPFLDGIDAICIEIVGNKEETKDFIKYLNAINQSYDKYKKYFDESAEQHWAFRVAVSLRHRKPVYLPVDIYDEAESVLSDSMFRPDFDIIFKFARNKNFSGLYEYINQAVEEKIKSITLRDKIVAGQVDMFIKKQKELNLKIHKLAIIQGYFHVSAPYIRELLPNNKVEELLFNMPAIKYLDSYPFAQMYFYKRNHPDAPIPEEIILRYFHHLFFLYSKNMAPPDLREFQQKKFKDLHDFTDFDSWVSEVNALTPDQLRAGVEARLFAEAMDD